MLLLKDLDSSVLSVAEVSLKISRVFFSRDTLFHTLYRFIVLPYTFIDPVSALTLLVG